MDLLQALANQPSLCYCGPLLFDVLKVHHNGTCWVVEMEAVETAQ